jgi:hypothetical protein
LDNLTAISGDMPRFSSVVIRASSPFPDFSCARFQSHTGAAPPLPFPPVLLV